MKRLYVLSLLFLGGCYVHDPYYHPRRYYHPPVMHYRAPICHTQYYWNPYTRNYYPRRHCY